MNLRGLAVQSRKVRHGEDRGGRVNGDSGVASATTGFLVLASLSKKGRTSVLSTSQRQARLKAISLPQPQSSIGQTKSLLLWLTLSIKMKTSAFASLVAVASVALFISPGHAASIAPRADVNTEEFAAVPSGGIAYTSSNAEGSKEKTRTKIFSLSAMAPTFALRSLAIRQGSHNLSKTLTNSLTLPKTTHSLARIRLCPGVAPRPRQRRTPAPDGSNA
ncbi:hypothetical protein FA10DRAFT_75690 [Acaromyces ingoldii]|uniref:Uncharacterized protein n=1 Tax=Acaromyces ingoldii TaxID=215250 RepID=A0A316YVM1_9BASI|nr:hypothetical protein FA10DRAFT_75690 [Acaromyces ingoldii]PWN91805.1 hypothetical protein FA10DRAFT_75690 [Acaromyces ingoldii]